MNLTNYHSHSLYCDGRADMESFAHWAKAKGFSAYGYSSHAPLPFPTCWTMEWDRMDDYLGEFLRLKQVYAGSVELYIALEIDYLNEDSHPASACFQALPLDYRIGSVHLTSWGMRIRYTTTPSGSGLMSQMRTGTSTSFVPIWPKPFALAI